MLCAKYQEAGLCGSREKCDRNYLVSKFAYVPNIQSRVKQEMDMPQIQNCVTRYSSPYWCSMPNIRKLASVVPEKNVTEIFCDADADDVDDARRRIVIPLCFASAKANRRHNKDVTRRHKYLHKLTLESDKSKHKLPKVDSLDLDLQSTEHWRLL